MNLLIAEKDLSTSREDYLDFLKKIKRVRKSNPISWSHPVVGVLSDYFDKNQIRLHGTKIQGILYEGLDF